MTFGRCFWPLDTKATVIWANAYEKNRVFFFWLICLSHFSMGRTYHIINQKEKTQLYDRTNISDENLNKGSVINRIINKGSYMQVCSDENRDRRDVPNQHRWKEGLGFSCYESSETVSMSPELLLHLWPPSITTFHGHSNPSDVSVVVFVWASAYYLGWAGLGWAKMLSLGVHGSCSYLGGLSIFGIYRKTPTTGPIFLAITEPKTCMR